MYVKCFRYERHIVFPKLLASICDDYAPQNSMFNADPSKIGTARRHFCTALSNKVNSYSYEVSFFNYKLKDTDSYVTYTEDGCILCATLYISCIILFLLKFKILIHYCRLK